MNSNTTNVKVKRIDISSRVGMADDSNTTNVKVKLTGFDMQSVTETIFKYNQC